MANPLDWLLLPKMPEPSPVRVASGPELRAYHPKPSEWFEQTIHSLLGGGPQASLAHENFARGVPRLLEMFPPLGIGLSAADLVRAKWDNDPMGAAAAAIGMIPGAGRAAPEVKMGADEILANIEKMLGPGSNAVAKYKANKASSADATEAALKAIEEILGPAPVHAPGPGTPYLMGGPANPANTLTKPNPIAASQVDLLNKIHENPIDTNPFDYKMNKFGNWDVFHTGTGEIHDVAQTQKAAEALTDVFGKLHAQNPDYKGPIWTGTKLEAPAAAKPIYDYDFPGNKAPSIPAHPPWLDQSAVLPEDAREAARLAGDYTTPAWRGIRVEPGKDVGTVFQGDEMFSSANPKLADMYSSNLGKHPGANPSQHSYREGASGMPFWINTNDYHVADAKGANWSDFNWKAIQQAKEAGKKGVVIHNVWDEPHSTKALGSPNTIYITFPEGLSTVKSKFAGQFNPNSKDIAKSILTTLGVGSTAYPFLQQDNRQ